MFFKSVVYKPFGKSKSVPYRASLYDGEKSNPFEEINTPQEYLEFLEKENSQLYYDKDNLDTDDPAKDDILEYILKEYS